MTGWIQKAKAAAQASNDKWSALSTDLQPMVLGEALKYEETLPQININMSVNEPPSPELMAAMEELGSKMHNILNPPKLVSYGHQPLQLDEDAFLGKKTSQKSISINEAWNALYNHGFACVGWTKDIQSKHLTKMTLELEFMAKPPVHIHDQSAIHELEFALTNLKVKD